MPPAPSRQRASLENRAAPWNNPNEKPLIYLEGVTKFFGSTKILDNITLSIYRQEFFSLLGQSGSGKTTLLRLLAAFEKPDAGKIYIGDIEVNKTPIHKLPVNMMSQGYALFPHLSVFENVGFELRQVKLPKKVIQERVQEMLALVHLSNFADRKPHELSGGQRQRVALARALANEPEVLLLDEPLAALDKTLREKTQFELVNIQEKLGVTFVMVTHDQEEALTTSTRIGIMNQGRIQQVGTPGEIYEYPNSLAVANFIGSINVFEGMITHHDETHLFLQCPDMDTPLAVGYSASVPDGIPAKVVIRPEKMMLSQRPFSKSSCNTTHGVVKDIAYLGDVSVYHIELESGKIIMATQPNLVRLAERPITWETHVYIKWSAENSLMLNV